MTNKHVAHETKWDNSGGFIVEPLKGQMKFLVPRNLHRLGIDFSGQSTMKKTTNENGKSNPELGGESTYHSKFVHVLSLFFLT